jgi:hypothetical protein
MRVKVIDGLGAPGWNLSSTTQAFANMLLQEKARPRADVRKLSCPRKQSTRTNKATFGDIFRLDPKKKCVS